MQNNYKERLNEFQLKALHNFPGAMLIVAGAGTGKTSTIVAKILNAIESGFASPGQIIATTFTNKAAAELKMRLKNYLGEECRNIMIGTFHSLALEILQKHSHLLESKSVNVLSYDDQIQVMRNILSKYSLKDMRASIVLEKIQRYKEDQSHAPGIDYRIINEYHQELKKLNSMDFADLLLNTIELFEKNTELMLGYKENYKLICVDEYQDINDLQYKWTSYIYGSKNHLCCVGDPDQAIYAFRGANADHILNFEKNFQNAQIIKLECNYRSAQNILENANKLISHNRNRIPKNLYTLNTENNQKVELYSTHSSRAEAENICQMVMDIKKSNPENSIAILVRSRMQIPEMEEALVRNQVSYKIHGAMQFMDRAEIKDMLAYFKFIHNPRDSIAFARMIQAPRRGIGSVTIKRIMEIAEEYEINLFEALKIVKDSSSQTVKDKISSLIILLEDANKIKDKDLVILVNQIYINSGYIDTLPSERRDNVQQWIRTLTEFDSLSSYLETVLWQADNTEVQQHEVDIMTIHSSKGLEFDCVFLSGWEDGILPHDFATNANDLEEERRLAYVALTRARKKVFISYSSSRMINGKIRNYLPSRFLKELKSVEFYKNPRNKGFKVGSEVVHPRFGIGSVQESGADLARVKFCDMTRLVELRMLRQI